MEIVRLGLSFVTAAFGSFPQSGINVSTGLHTRPLVVLALAFDFELNHATPPCNPASPVDIWSLSGCRTRMSR
jgi:hypothetical protein